jgi:hypothetical protein
MTFSLTCLRGKWILCIKMTSGETVKIYCSFGGNLVFLTICSYGTGSGLFNRKQDKSYIDVETGKSKSR